MTLSQLFTHLRKGAITAFCLAGGMMHAEQSVIGKWRATSVSGVQYRNSTTGVSAPTNGSSFTYDFRADGTYEHTGLMQMVAYNCTTKLWGGESGRYRVEPGHLVLEPVKGVVNTNNSCSGRDTREEKTLGKRTLDFHFESNQGAPMLVTGGTDGKSRPDYYKREQ